MLKDLVSIYFITKIIFYIFYMLNNINIVFGYIFISFLIYNILASLKEILQDGDIKKIIIFLTGIVLSILL